jgi:hypothetical protein
VQALGIRHERFHRKTAGVPRAAPRRRTRTRGTTPGARDDPRRDAAAGRGGRFAGDPPDHPAQVAQQLAGDLTDLLTERVDDRVHPEVRTGSGRCRFGGTGASMRSSTTSPGGGRSRSRGCLSSRTRPPPGGVGLVSLPALGVGQRRAVRAPVAGLVEGLTDDLPAPRRPGDQRLAQLITWLILRHDLWQKASEHTPKELARLFNIGTVLTLALAAAVCYVVLLVGTATAAARLIDPSVLELNVGHPVGPGDYLALAWIISSLATVGGAVGSGLEDEDQVRAAAYPKPVGWQDQRAGPGREAVGQSKNRAS